MTKRKFACVSPLFWHTGGRRIRMLGLNPTLLALYLISSPHAGMAGIYHLPLAYVSHETRLPIEQIKEALEALISLDFCQYDPENEIMWVKNFIKWQVSSKKITEGDKRWPSIEQELSCIPESCPLLAAWWQQYEERVPSRPALSSCSAPPPNPEKDQDQDHEQDNEQDRGACDAPSNAPSNAQSMIEKCISMASRDTADAESFRKKIRKLDA